MNQEGVELLRKAMSIDPNNADIRHSLGLRSCVSTITPRRVPELRQASELAPDNARYAYVYAIALNSTGAHGEAMELLELTHKRHPTDRDMLLALVSIARETGDFATALSHARELARLLSDRHAASHAGPRPRKTPSALRGKWKKTWMSTVRRVPSVLVRSCAPNSDLPTFAVRASSGLASVNQREDLCSFGASCGDAAAIFAFRLCLGDAFQLNPP